MHGHELYLKMRHMNSLLHHQGYFKVNEQLLQLSCFLLQQIWQPLLTHSCLTY